jgi:hypothetical protein
LSHHFGCEELCEARAASRCQMDAIAEEAILESGPIVDERDPEPIGHTANERLKALLTFRRVNPPGIRTI